MLPFGPGPTGFPGVAGHAAFAAQPWSREVIWAWLMVATLKPGKVGPPSVTLATFGLPTEQFGSTVGSGVAEILELSLSQTGCGYDARCLQLIGGPLPFVRSEEK